MADVEIKIKTKDQASKEIAKVEKALAGFQTRTQSTAKPFKDLIGSVSNFAVMAGATIGPVVALGAALKRAFDLGKEGAALEFARDKFDRLAVAVGTTSSVLMDDLRRATRGLVSDTQLMVSATDFMALGLAKTRDEVVRLAKVAGGLGMNMNQLVLTLTNQTTMRFDALGVSVDGFDKKVDALKKSGMEASAAFKEAFLQQAEQQLATVGERADSSISSFDRLEASSRNLGDAIKVALNPVVAQTAELMAGATSAADDWLRRWLLMTKIQGGGELAEIERQIMELNAQRDYFIAMNSGYTSAQQKTAYETAKVAAETRLAAAANALWVDQIDLVNQRLYGSDPAFQKFRVNVGEQAYMIYDATAAMEAAKGPAQNYDRAVDGVADSAAKAAGQLKRLIDQTNRNVGDAITEMIKNIDWLLHGGAEVEAAYKAIAESDLSLEDKKAALGATLEAATAVQLAANQIDPATAAENLSKNLNMPLAQAQALVTELLKNDGKVINLKVLIDYASVGIPYSAYERAKTGGTGGGRTGGNYNYATGSGGWQTVPQGYPNDSFLVGLSSGEKYNVRNQAQSGGGSGGVTVNGLTINVPQGTSPMQVANLVVAKLNDMARAAARGGAGYAGV